MDTVAVRAVIRISECFTMADRCQATVLVLNIVDRDVRCYGRSDMGGDEDEPEAAASSSDADRNRCPESTDWFARIRPDFGGEFRVIFEVERKRTLSVTIAVDTECHTARGCC